MMNIKMAIATVTILAVIATVAFTMIVFDAEILFMGNVNLLVNSVRL